MDKLKPIAMIVLVSALIALAWASDDVKGWVRGLPSRIEPLGMWGPVALGLLYIPATVLFIPGSVLTLAAGALFGVVIGVVTVSIGSLAGSTAAFLIGRYLARDWVVARARSHRRFDAVDRAVEHGGFKIVLLTRLSPLFPYNLLGYFFGITRVRTADYILASWIGMLPGTAVFVYLGYAGREALGGARGRSPGQWALLAIGLLATIAVSVVITRIARHATTPAPQEPPHATGDADHA